MKELVIDAKNLRKYYQRGREIVKALDGVNLEVERGALISLVGPSGSGKTTLMNLLGLLDIPTEGDLKIDGLEVSNLKEEKLFRVRREKIGFIFQKFYLIPTLTVKENILLPLIFSKKKINEFKLKEILERVDLEGKEELLPDRLSGGDKQKVCIARCLIKDTKVILADEPTGRLESKIRKEVINIFRGLKDLDIAIVVATHDLKLAEETEKIIHLQDGKIIPKEESTLYIQ